MSDMKTPKELLIEGVSDASGFVGGALICFGLGQVLGFDIFAPGYGLASITGILLVGIGGGTGLKFARIVRERFNQT